MEQTSSLPELLYLFDPLCTWCYGMTPVVQRLQQEFAGRLDVAVLCGGMLTGAEVGPIAESWDHLAPAAAQVAHVTGAAFGQAFQRVGEHGEQVLNSEPPSRAVAIFRQLDAQQRTIHFAHDVQAAFFHNGHDLNDPATYPPLLAPYDLDLAEFRRLWAAPDTAQAVQREFAMVARLDIQGFPTSILRIGNDGYVLARGYQPYSAFVDGLKTLLTENQLG